MAGADADGDAMDEDAELSQKEAQVAEEANAKAIRGRIRNFKNVIKQSEAQAADDRMQEYTAKIADNIKRWQAELGSTKPPDRVFAELEKHLKRQHKILNHTKKRADDWAKKAKEVSQQQWSSRK